MSYTTFKDLHHQNDILLLGNVWDAHSAQLAQQAGFKALGSSSHAIANSLGYADGEQIPVDELLAHLQRMIKSVSIPLSVDFESGYSANPQQVAKNVKKLIDMGVVGINLEDGQVVNGKRELGPSELLVEKIKAIKSLDPNIYINARADTYTTKHPEALSESIQRAELYTQAGADGIFIPLIESPEDIKAFTQQISLPLNVFLTPKLPQIKELESLGVKRISHGPKVYEWIVRQYSEFFSNYLRSPELPKG